MKKYVCEYSFWQTDIKKLQDKNTLVPLSLSCGSCHSCSCEFLNFHHLSSDSNELFFFSQLNNKVFLYICLQLYPFSCIFTFFIILTYTKFLFCCAPLVHLHISSSLSFQINTQIILEDVTTFILLSPLSFVKAQLVILNSITTNQQDLNVDILGLIINSSLEHQLIQSLH